MLVYAFIFAERARFGHGLPIFSSHARKKSGILDPSSKSVSQTDFSAFRIPLAKHSTTLLLSTSENNAREGVFSTCGEGGIRSQIISSPSLRNFRDPGSASRLLARQCLRLSHYLCSHARMNHWNSRRAVLREPLRRGRDSNPREVLPSTSLARRHNRPL